MRMAVASAIDRKSLAAQSYSNALAFAATGMIPPVLGSTPDLITHDLARARDLFAKANVNTKAPLVLGMLPVPRPYLPEPKVTAGRKMPFPWFCSTEKALVPLCGTAISGEPSSSRSALAKTCGYWIVP